LNLLKGEIVRLTTRSLTAWLLVIAAGLAPVALRAQPQPDARSAILVTPEWLNAHLADPKLVLLHVGARQEYDARHIPGAQFITVADVAAPRDTSARPLSNEMPAPEALRARLATFGISGDSRIVVYFGSNTIAPATRVALTLEFAGLGGATSLLDGGMSAWLAAGYATTNEVPSPHQGTLAAIKPKPIVVTGEWVRDNVTKPGYALIDARAVGYYDGTLEGGPTAARRRGHIPGAVSLPFDSVWTARYTLRSPSELRELFAKAGIKSGDTVVAYCHTGQQATSILFAARSLGYRTLLYDGSFEDWAFRDWPVEVKPKGGG
jgi:thiosulfate/3-mercaptopyruvate sulfurtransferase